MKNPSKTNQDLIQNISALKLRIQQLEQSESEHREVEAALRESEERYRIAIETSNEGVAIIQNSDYVYANDAFLTMFGYYTLDEMKWRVRFSIVHPDDRERVIAYSSARQKGQYAPEEYEFKGIKKDGTPINIHISVTTILYKTERAKLLFMRDITARKRMEETRVHREKLDGLLAMAGTICHELNQPIQIVSGYIDLLSMGTFDDRD